MKKIAVMQPYIFPYVGYFQLISAVDVFVFYDDVNFIKQGWINRNRVLMSGKDITFAIPLKSVSSFALIKDTSIHKDLYGKWRKKFLKGLVQSYKKAPFFKPVFDMVEDILYKDTESISELAIYSITTIAEYLELSTTFLISSKEFDETVNSDRAERLNRICHLQGASIYINALGGRDLYDKNDFAEGNIKLQFIEPSIEAYNQFDFDFIGGLSIIDVLMFNDKKATMNLLNNYNLT